ncbi:MAG: hypothetical protein ACOZF2_07045 [Thermodesulfobacteriota bacterium]
MATTIGELLVKLSAEIKGLEAGLAKARGELSGFQSYAGSLAASLKKTLAFAGVAVGLWEIAGALKSFSKDAAMTGARTETLLVAMEQVGRNAGLSAQSLEYFVNQLKAAGVTSQEAMLGVTKFMAAGLDLGKIKELATRARDIAVVANVNTSEAFSRLIQGIVSGEVEMLRRLMVNVGHIDDLLKRHAATLGVEKDQIDAVTKANIVLNAVLESSVRFAGAAAAADATVGKQLASLARFAEEAKNALWTLFQPVMLAGVKSMSQAWKDLEAWAKANQTTLAQYGKTMAEWVQEMVQGARALIQFTSEVKTLLKLLAELWVASKIAGVFVGLAGGLRTAAAEVGILTALLIKLKVLIGGPWKLIITIGLVGLYEAYKALKELRAAAPDWRMDKPFFQNIQEARGRDKARFEGELNQQALATEATRRGVTEEEIQRILKENLKRQAEKKPLLELPPVLPEHEIPAEKAEREAAAAKKKAEEEAKAKLPAGKEGKGAAQKSTEDLLAMLDQYLDAKQQKEIQAAEESFATFKAENDKKRAELELALAEGKITGEQYYATLKEMQQAETEQALALIQKKIAAENQAYERAKAAVTRSDASPEAQELELAKLREAHEMRVLQLSAESGRIRIENAKKLIDLAKQEFENRKRIEDTLASGREEAALGPVAEKEAEINRLLRERLKLREELVRLGATEGQVSQFDRITKELEINKRFGEQIKGYTNLISGFFGDLTDAIMAGENDLRQTLNKFFKSLFKQALEPTMKQMMQWLTDFFKQMFGSLGETILNSLMGVIALVGMFLTSGGGGSSWTSSGVQSSVTGHEAVRGIIAGETSIPVAQVSESLAEAVAPHLSVLRQIEFNTRGSGGGGGAQVSVTIQGVKEAIREAMDAYFRDYLLMGARG